MTYVISRNFRLHCARQYAEQFGEASPSNIYLLVGKVTPWPDDNNPPAIADTLKETVFDVWNYALGMKKMVASQVSLSAARINWTSGTVYTQYDDISPYNNSAFYVLTDDFNVYKCLSNNNGAASTAKPIGTLASTFYTGDGYLWKYMYSISGPDAVNFLTSDFMPVKTLTTNDGSAQWTVQQSAIDGGIHTVKVNTGGTGYISTTGTIVSVASSTTAVIASSASATDTIYNNYGIFILSGTGAGQYRKITGYVGASRTITVSQAWTINPNSTSSYIISPYLSIVGNGTGVIGYTNVFSGAIRDIAIVNPGSGYRTATATIGGDTGSGATIRPILSPIGGHGSNAEEELFASNVTCNLRLAGDESGNLFVGNEFRQTSLVVDPLLNNNSVATDLVYDLTTRLTISSPAGTFSNDEIVTGSSSGASMTFVHYVDTTHIQLSGQNNNFTVGETITGGTSGATAIVSAVTKPAIKAYEGLSIYVRDAVPTSRQANQTENYKITTKF